MAFARTFKANASMFVTDDPMFVTDDSMFVTDAPMFVTDAPMFVTDDPMFVTDAPMFVTDASMFVTEDPMFVTDASMFVTEDPMFVTEDPMFEAIRASAPTPSQTVEICPPACPEPCSGAYSATSAISKPSVWKQGKHPATPRHRFDGSGTHLPGATPLCGATAPPA